MAMHGQASYKAVDERPAWCLAAPHMLYMLYILYTLQCVSTYSPGSWILMQTALCFIETVVEAFAEAGLEKNMCRSSSWYTTH